MKKIIVSILFVFIGIFALCGCSGYKDALSVTVNGQTYSVTYSNGSYYHIGSCEEIQCKEANGYLYVRYRQNGKWYEFSVKDSESEYYITYS